MPETADRLIKFGEHAVSAAIAAGAQSAEVFGRYGDVLRLSIGHDGDVAHREGSEGSIVVKVWHDGAAGTVTTNAPFSADPVALAREALEVPRVAEAAPNPGLDQNVGTEATAQPRQPGRKDVTASMRKLFEDGANVAHPLGCQYTFRALDGHG